MESSVVKSIVSVNAIMVYGDEILLQRVVNKNNTLWLPGGKVEWEESFEDALFREIREETGIESEKYSYEKIAILHERPQVTCKHIYVLSMKEKIEKFSFEDSEISDCFWMKLSDIPTDLEAYRNGWVYYTLRDYIAGKFNNAQLYYQPNN